MKPELHQFQQGLGVSETTEPKDKTPEKPGSDKNLKNQRNKS